jgi:hypothetical protein
LNCDHPSSFTPIDSSGKTHLFFSFIRWMFCTMATEIFVFYWSTKNAWFLWFAIYFCILYIIEFTIIDASVTLDWCNKTILSNKNLFPNVLKDRKAKTKAQVDLVSCEGLLLASIMGTFLLCTHIEEVVKGISTISLSLKQSAQRAKKQISQQKP